MSDEIGRLPEDENSPNPIDQAVGANALPDDYVLVFDSPDYETGEIVCATLAAQGIHAIMKHPQLGPAGGLLPPLGINWSHAIYVAPADLGTARQMLAAQEPSEAELAAEQAADPTTIEEAERRVRDA